MADRHGSLLPIVLIFLPATSSTSSIACLFATPFCCII